MPDVVLPYQSLCSIAGDGYHSQAGERCYDDNPKYECQKRQPRNELGCYPRYLAHSYYNTCNEYVELEKPVAYIIDVEKVEWRVRTLVQEACFLVRTSYSCLDPSQEPPPEIPAASSGEESWPAEDGHSDSLTYATSNVRPAN